MRRALVALLLAACSNRPERVVAAAPDAGPQPLGEVLIQRTRILSLELRGGDFEDARGRGCPLEAVVELPDGGDTATLRFRCVVYGSGP